MMCEAILLNDYSLCSAGCNSHWAGGFLSRLQRGRFAYALKNKALNFAASKWFSAFPWANQWEYFPEFPQNSDRFL
jgi:hypothetical protein